MELRARVEGFLEKINFKPADDVKEGQVLFQIDPRPYQAQVSASEADLASKQATYVRDDAEYQRNYQLYQKNVISQQDYIKFKARARLLEGRGGPGRRHTRDREARPRLLPRSGSGWPGLLAATSWMSTWSATPEPPS